MRRGGPLSQLLSSGSCVSSFDSGLWGSCMLLGARNKLLSSDLPPQHDMRACWCPAHFLPTSSFPFNLNKFHFPLLNQLLLQKSTVVYVFLHGTLTDVNLDYFYYSLEDTLKHSEAVNKIETSENFSLT